MNDVRKPPSWRRWWVGALVLALVAALVYAAYRPRALLVEVAPVRVGTFEQTLEEDGQLRLKNRYVITAPTQAALLRPTLKVGDVVHAGDVVARLEPAVPQMIDARTRAVLQQRVGSADAARRAAAAQVLRLQSALGMADLDARRAARLAQENFISPAARDQSLLAQQAAQQALNAALAEQVVADYALAEARAALGRAEPRSGATPAGLWEIKSPIGGYVIRLHQDSATPVNAGQALVDIGDTNEMEAVIDVLSGDALRVHIGAPVRLFTGNSSTELTGHVARVEPVAFTKVSALGIEEQRVNVVVALDAPGSNLPAVGDGFRVDARIAIASRPQALLVPTAALVRDGSQWRVFVLEGNTARARPVQIDDRNTQDACIASGVHTGESVVLYPGGALQNGQRIRLRDRPP